MMRFMRKTDIILPEHLPPDIYNAPGHTPRYDNHLPDDRLVTHEKAAIRNALIKSGSNRKKAARILGIGDATLYRKIKKYGIKN